MYNENSEAIMNKSNIAYKIVEDIYTLSSKYENAKTKLENNEITKNQFANAQYVIMCKSIYLSELISELKLKGFKFTKFE